MNKQLCLTATAGLLAITSASAKTFPTGESYYGSQVPAARYHRVIELGDAKPINIVCGK